MESEIEAAVKLAPRLKEVCKPVGVDDDGTEWFKYEPGFSDRALAEELGINIERVSRVRKVVCGPLQRSTMIENTMGKWERVRDQLKELTAEVATLRAELTALQIGLGEKRRADLPRAYYTTADATSASHMPNGAAD